MTPPQRFPGVMGWSPEDASLGAPARSNKIYTYDVVFPIGETNINVKGKTKFLIKNKRHRNNIQSTKKADCKSRKRNPFIS